MSTTPGTPQSTVSDPSAQPDADQRLWATLVHAGGILFGWLAPLLALLLLKDRGAFVRGHAVTALNFQLTLLIAGFAGWVLSIVGIGLLVLLAVFVVNVVFSVLAALAAHRGGEYAYPLAIRFLR